MKFCNSLVRMMKKTSDVRACDVRPKLDQIHPKWEKSGTLRLIFSTCSVLIFESLRLIPFGVNLVELEANGIALTGAN